MAKAVSSVATEVAARWLAANDRRKRKGLAEVDLSIENMREFADGCEPDADTLRLDLIADLALQKIHNFRKRVE